jgi:tight adherence protein C
MTALLGLAWALLALAASRRWWPSPASARARALAPAHATGAAHARGAAAGRPRGPRGPRPHPRPRPTVATVAEGLGAALVRRARPPHLRHQAAPVDPVLARRVGGAVLAAAAVLPVAPAAAPSAALVAWAAPPVRARRAERRRLAELEAGLPEVVDLLGLAVGAGLGVAQAVAAVARRAEGPLAGELARVSREVTMGRRLADALDDLPGRAGEAVRPLAAALLASERYGAPLGPGLDRLADDVRRRRRRAAEEAARRLPVKLLFPLVTCTLPAFALLTVAPLIAGALRSLRL